MQIEYHKPAARGVATLMYVGDDQAVERAVAAPNSLETALGALGLAAALFGRGTLRTLGAAAAVIVGVRYARSL
jgi:hypothetical protein